VPLRLLDGQRRWIQSRTLDFRSSILTLKVVGSDGATPVAGVPGENFEAWRASNPFR
jgi:hypothetical protein